MAEIEDSETAGAATELRRRWRLDDSGKGAFAADTDADAVDALDELGAAAAALIFCKAQKEYPLAV